MEEKELQTWNVSGRRERRRTGDRKRETASANGGKVPFIEAFLSETRVAPKMHSY